VVSRGMGAMQGQITYLYYHPFGFR